MCGVCVGGMGVLGVVGGGRLIEGCRNKFQRCMAYSVN